MGNGGCVMANVKIVWKEGTFDVSYSNLNGKGEPRKVNGKPILMKPDGGADVARQNSMGEPLAQFTLDKDGNPVQSGGRAYCTYSEVLSGKKDVKVPKAIADTVNEFYQTLDGELIPAKEYGKTSIYEIKAFEPLINYTDKYIVKGYYGIAPYQGESKKNETDHNRTLRKAKNMALNTIGMKKLYDYLTANQVIGRAELNLTSGSTLSTLAYVRPITLDDKGSWALEFGIFKQGKRFPWVGSPVVDETPIEQEEYAIPEPVVEDI
jgi:hypothetical protein